jgi:predicted hydrocarbon binding protein
MTTIITPIVKETSSWGPGDPDIWRPYYLAKQLVDYLDADDSVVDRTDFAADRLKDELETALVHYQTITSDGFLKLNLSQQRAAYESLYSDLWTFYKDRMQKYLSEVGIEIGFIFMDAEKFKKHSITFSRNHPEYKDFLSFIELQRNGWQNDFANYRNVHEHHGDLRGNVKDYDNPNDAKRIFAQVCWTYETIVAALVSWKLKASYNVIEINPGTTVFDRRDRYVIEHAIMTQQRLSSSGS